MFCLYIIYPEKINTFNKKESGVITTTDSKENKTYKYPLITRGGRIIFIYVPMLS